MPKTLPISKPDYSLEMRYKLSSGEWSEWIKKGKGMFQTIEIVQSQIRIIVAPHKGNDIEVKFEYKGYLYDFLGKFSGEVIKLK
jgi:hypothetical protein